MFIRVVGCWLNGQKIDLIFEDQSLGLAANVNEGAKHPILFFKLNDNFRDDSNNITAGHTLIKYVFIGLNLIFFHIANSVRFRRQAVQRSKLISVVVKKGLPLNSVSGKLQAMPQTDGQTNGQMNRHTNIQTSDSQSMLQAKVCKNIIIFPL